MKAAHIQKAVWIIILGLFVALSCPAQEETATFESLVTDLKKKSSGRFDIGIKYARCNAAKQLGAMKDPRAVDPLLETLKDPEESLRDSCARALGEIGDLRALEPLKELATNDTDETVRFAAVIGLHDLGQPMTQDLIAYLKGGEAEAATILGNDKDRSAIGALIEALDYDDWNEYQTIEVIKALGTMGARDAVPALMGMVAQGPTDYSTDALGKEAAIVLGQIGDNRAVDPLLKALASQSILTKTRDGAIEALGMLGDQRAVEPLIKALAIRSENGNVYGRVDVATSLGKIGGNRATASLLKGFHQCAASREINFKDGLRAVLRDISDPDAMPEFVKVLSDSDPELCCLAAYVLGRAGDPRGIQAMVANLNSPNPDVKGAAINSLPGMGSQAVPELLELLKSPGVEEETRSWIVLVLGDIGDQDAAEDLLPLLSDHDPYVRLAAFEALGKIGSPDSVPKLSRQLKHPDARIRRAAVAALEQIGDPEAIPALTEAAGDSDDIVRSVALAALAATDDPSVIKTLAAGTKDTQEEVMSSAAAGLAAIGTEESLGLLTTIMSSGDELIKADTIFALAESESEAAAAFVENAAKTDLDFVGNLARVSLVQERIETQATEATSTGPDETEANAADPVHSGKANVPVTNEVAKTTDINVAETNVSDSATQVDEEPEKKAAGVLFEEDFDDGTSDGFGNETGNWKVVNGKYAPTVPVSTSATNADLKLSTRHSSFGQPDWKYYSVEADFLDAYNGGLIIRGQDSFGGGGIALSIVPGDDIYLPDGFINLQDGWGGAPIAGTELGFKGEEDLQIKVESFGETGDQGGEIFRVYVNGELKITTEWLCSEGRNDQGKVYLYLNQHFDEQSAGETMGFTQVEINAEKKHLAGQSWDNIIVRGKKSAPIKIAEPEPTPTPNPPPAPNPSPTIHSVIMLPTSTPKPPPIIKEKSISITGIEQQKKSISVKLTGKGLKHGVVIQGELNRSYDNSTIQRGASVVIDDGSASLHFRAPYMGWPPGQYTVQVLVGGEIKATHNVEISE